jgi:tetratricopeptide (TPR) repeat protein
LRRYEESEKFYLKAQDVYAAHFPQSEFYANCLNNIGSMYGKERRKVREHLYLRAIEIYSTYFPQSGFYANCLHNLGKLYEEDERKAEASQKFETARQIYQQLGLQTEAESCNHALKRLNG